MAGALIATGVIGLLTPLIPILVRLIGAWVEKKFVDDPAAKRSYLLFIESINPKVPAKLYKNHQAALRELRKEILAEEETNRINKQNLDNYQKAYESTYADKLKTEEKLRKTHSDNLALEDKNMRLEHEIDRLRSAL